MKKSGEFKESNNNAQNKTNIFSTTKEDRRFRVLLVLMFRKTDIKKEIKEDPKLLRKLKSLAKKHNMSAKKYAKNLGFTI